MLMVYCVLATFLILIDGWMGVVEFLVAIGIAIAAYAILG